MSKKAIYDLSYGLYMIGTVGENIPCGCIANTVFQVTSNPQKIVVSLNHDNYTTSCIQSTREFTVSILSEKVDPAIIGQFGFKTARECYKFENIEFKRLVNNMPVLTNGISAWLHCKVENMVDTGTHMLFIAEVIDFERLSDDEPMTYSYYHNVIKGRAPKNAPTYQEEPLNTSENEEYVCDVCNYVYSGKNLKDLPDDWKCPVCGMDKSHLKKS